MVVYGVVSSCAPTNAVLPTLYDTPSTTPTIPFPFTASMFVATAGSTFLDFAYVSTPRASGCSEYVSMPASIASVSLVPSKSITSGAPLVIVPVLSTTIVSASASSSRDAASLMRMPRCAAAPTAVTIDIGVASPSAHGHAITSTVTNAVSPSTGLPSTLQMMSARNAIASTVGVKTEEIRSTSASMGALLPCASSTICTIRASIVSPPIAVARKVNEPVVFMVPPMTISPACLCAGSGSPVTSASSRYESPSTIMPSSGTFVPGSTRIISPTITSETAISTAMPSRITSAVFAESSSSFSMASLATIFERASRYFPSVIKTTIMIVAS